MNFFLANNVALKHLETPSLYHVGKDELFELDDESFRFLQACSTPDGCAAPASAFIDYCMEEGLLSQNKVSVKRPPVNQAPRPSLRYLELQITDACNLCCKHCYIDDAPRNELSPEQIRNILTEFEEMQGLRVLLSGGEPLVHSGFAEINEMLPDFSLRTVLFTNGLLLDRAKLGGLNVDEIQVSIDGLEAAHDHVRGTGTFSRAMRTIKQALDAGFEVSISTMVHRANLADFDALERLLKQLGIKDWTVDVPCTTGRFRKEDDLFVSPEEGGRYLGYGFGNGLHASGQGYGCGLHLMAVLADGKIAKCTFYGDRSVATIQDGLRTGWSRIRPIQLSHLACKCSFLEICRGGCRYRAELLDNPNGRDLYRCMLYGII